MLKKFTEFTFIRSLMKLFLKFHWDFKRIGKIQVLLMPLPPSCMVTHLWEILDSLRIEIWFASPRGHPHRGIPESSTSKLRMLSKLESVSRRSLGKCYELTKKSCEVFCPKKATSMHLIYVSRGYHVRIFQWTEPCYELKPPMNKFQLKTYLFNV